MFENKAQMLKIDDTISSHFLEMHTNINHTLIAKYRSSCALHSVQIQTKG